MANNGILFFLKSTKRGTLWVGKGSNPLGAGPSVPNPKSAPGLELSLKRYFTCDRFSKSYGGLKIAILANFGQLTRDIFRGINASAEIQFVLEVVPIWLKVEIVPNLLKEAYLPQLICYYERNLSLGILYGVWGDFRKKLNFKLLV